MTKEERIKSEGSKFDYDNHEDCTIMDGYIAGAKSERNKTIDEAIKIIDGVKTDSIDKEYLLKFLDSLKVNP